MDLQSVSRTGIVLFNLIITAGLESFPQNILQDSLFMQFNCSQEFSCYFQFLKYSGKQFFQENVYRNAITK